MRLRFWAITMLSLLLTTATPVRIRAGPIEEATTEIPSPPVPSSTPTVVPPSPAPTRTPTPTRTLTPTPTLDPVVEITTAHILERVIIWKGEVERINRNENLGLDTALVLAVMAAESGGDWTAVSSAGACGLMQVIPRPWYELDAGSICKSNVGNIYMGMYILRWSLDLAVEERLDLRYGLAFFNCSYEGVMSDRCGSKGGLNYADHILEFWLPRIEERLEEKS